MLLRPDKGLGVILVNIAVYITKIKSILDDQLEFRVGKYNEDLGKSTEKQTTSMVGKLLKKKMIANPPHNDDRIMIFFKYCRL